MGPVYAAIQQDQSLKLAEFGILEITLSVLGLPLLGRRQRNLGEGVVDEEDADADADADAPVVVLKNTHTTKTFHRQLTVNNVVQLTLDGIDTTITTEVTAISVACAMLGQLPELLESTKFKENAQCVEITILGRVSPGNYGYSEGATQQLREAIYTNYYTQQLGFPVIIEGQLFPDTPLFPIRVDPQVRNVPYTILLVSMFGGLYLFAVCLYHYNHYG